MNIYRVSINVRFDFNFYWVFEIWLGGFVLLRCA